MKKYNILSFLIILNLFISVNLFSQPYKSIFGIQSTQWNELTYSISSWTCLLNTIKDTIINTKSYKKVTYSGFGCPMVYNVAFLREDTMTGKAWVYDFYHSNERLIMDLSLNVGDTFRIYPNSLMFDTIVIADSVYLENSLKKVRFNINFQFVNNEKFTFIEGIGTNIGVDYQINPYFLNGLGNTYLLCSYKDSSLSYKNNYLDTCYIVSVGIKEEIIENGINIFPNPISNISTITLNNTDSKFIKFEVYNLLGERVNFIAIEGATETSITINRNDYIAGYYIGKFTDVHRNSTNIKIMIL